MSSHNRSGWARWYEKQDQVSYISSHVLNLIRLRKSPRRGDAFDVRARGHASSGRMTRARKGLHFLKAANPYATDLKLGNWSRYIIQGSIAVIV